MPATTKRKRKSKWRKKVGSRCYLYGRRDQTKRYENSATMIRKLLLNYDLEMTRASTIIEKAQSQLDLYSSLVKQLEPLNGKPRKNDRRKQAVALITYKQYKQYLDELTTQRESLQNEVDAILEKYEEKYKKVFELAFIERGYTAEMIADEMGYSVSQALRIISTLGEELIALNEKKKRQKAKESQ